MGPVQGEGEAHPAQSWGLHRQLEESSQQDADTEGRDPDVGFQEENADDHARVVYGCPHGRVGEIPPRVEDCRHDAGCAEEKEHR